jgi:hypothetical protein
VSVGGRVLPAGAHVVLLAQPAGGFAKTVLERQRYPDARIGPEGLPRRPYDATAHTLPLLMGVEVLTAETPFAADLARVDEVRPPAGAVRPGRGRWLALPHTPSGFAAAGRLLREGHPVHWALAGFSQDRAGFPAGTLLVRSQSRPRVAALARELALEVRPVRSPPAALLMHMPRVGLYQSWVPAIDEGWTRFVFEKQLDLPYRTLHDADIRAGGLRAGLDVIVIPEQSPAQIVDGHPAGTIPPEYVGGLGKEGVAALRAFVEEGGTLVTLDGASRFAIQHLGVPVRDALAPWTRRGRRAYPEAPEEQGAAEFYAPGTVLEALAAEDDPLVHGVEPSVAVWYESSPAFETSAGARTLLRYPARNPLLSGWLIGPDKLQGLGALAEAPLGRGRVVLFGFRPQYRAQSWGTYVLLLNAIYSSALERTGTGTATGTGPRLTQPAPLR